MLLVASVMHGTHSPCYAKGAKMKDDTEKIGDEEEGERRGERESMSGHTHTGGVRESARRERRT